MKFNYQLFDESKISRSSPHSHPFRPWNAVPSLLSSFSPADIGEEKMLNDLPILSNRILLWGRAHHTVHTNASSSGIGPVSAQLITVKLGYGNSTRLGKISMNYRSNTYRTHLHTVPSVLTFRFNRFVLHLSMARVWLMGRYDRSPARKDYRTRLRPSVNR